MSRSHPPTSPSVPQNPDALLARSMLYLLASTAQRRELGIKVPLEDVHRSFGSVASTLRALRIPILFDTGTGRSRQIDSGIQLLAPYDLRIENPRYAILLSQEKARHQLDLLKQSLPPEVRGCLDRALAPFTRRIDRYNLAKAAT